MKHQQPHRCMKGAKACYDGISTVFLPNTSGHRTR